MVVYADVVLAVNTALNFLLLRLGSRLCTFPARPWRCLLGGFLGGVYALAALLPIPQLFSAWPGQMAAFGLMCLVAFGAGRRAVRPAALTFLCSAALAGVLYLLSGAMNMDAVECRGLLVYPFGANILLLLAGAFYLAAGLLVSSSLRHGRGEVYPMRLRCADREIRLTALYDTGNNLTEPLSGMPVLVVFWQRGAELLGLPRDPDLFSRPAEFFPQLARRLPQCRLRLVPYRAVGVEGGLLLAAACRAYIGKKEYSVLAALSPTPVSDGGSYEALIGGTVF